MKRTKRQILVERSLTEDSRYLCGECTGTVLHARWNLGYRTCLDCGEQEARQVKHTIAPLHKQAYEVISNPDWLKQMNKGGLNR